MIDLVHDNLEKIHELCERCHVRKLEIFGSASDGRYREGESDLDFIVEFQRLTPEAHGDAYFDLLFALEDTFCRKIDLVELPPPERANPYFISEIAKTRQVIHESSVAEISV